MLVIVTATMFLAALFLVWRIRFGYPPDDAPRVLCFHKVTRRFCWEGTWLSPGRFERLIDDLAAHGYRFVSEDEYLRGLERPIVDAARSILLTFDDAYAELMETAVPALRARGIPFVVFVVTDYAGRNNDWDLSLGRAPHRHASWDELEKMIAAGAAVGSHGATHRDLSISGAEEAAQEILRSREEIRRRLGVDARTLSFPFGRYPRDHEAMVREAGYEAAFSLYPPHSNAIVDRHALRRTGVYAIDPPALIRARLSRHPLFWFEEMKCRTINAVSRLTPLLTRSRRVPDR